MAALWLLLLGAQTALALLAPVKTSRAPSALGATTVKKIGLFGGGTVGGGIVEIIEQRRAQLEAATGGVGLEVKTVVVRDKNKPRDWALPPGCAITESFDDVLEDDDIDIVIEVIGGTTLAKDVVVKSLKARKDVVTANKALIADCLPELDALIADLNSGDEPPVQFGYEAAVCGGIPIIHTMNTDFVGDDVTRIRGIMNGCTNFMLTKMEAEGLSYTDCLAEATELGYAEEDPTLDVGGFDARSKLAILIRLAFGVDVDENEITCKGITGLKTIDFEYCNDQLKGTVKLLACAAKEGDQLTAYVTPAFVPKGATLASIGDATNAVEVSSANLDSSLFVGRGAGRFPTANSCISDIVAAAREGLPEPFAKKVDGLTFKNDYSSRFYVRVQYRNENGIIEALGRICASNGVGIYSLLQKPGSDYFVLVTETSPLSGVKKVAVDVEATSWCVGDTFFMPVAQA